MSGLSSPSDGELRLSEQNARLWQASALLQESQSHERQAVEEKYRGRSFDCLPRMKIGC